MADNKSFQNKPQKNNASAKLGKGKHLNLPQGTPMPETLNEMAAEPTANPKGNIDTANTEEG